MSNENWPPLKNGTRIRTTHENESMRREWTDEGRAAKKWGVTGVIVHYHDSHGLCYDVRHEDGSRGCYDPSEFEVLDESKS